MNVFFNGFWSGFHDRTNGVCDIFFIKLMKEVYNSDISVTFDINIADILIENTQIRHSFINYKKWKHTYLFSGESYLHSNADQYSCVLYGQRNHKNIVNVPLYIPYYVCSFDENYITDNKVTNVDQVPKNEVLVMISNPGGYVRNKFVQLLEQHMNVTYAGNYKNNTGGAFQAYYSSDEFREYVSKYKFILAMENSEEDTYITEKITHGLLAGSIPIYWGSKRVSDYFNSERFIEIKDEGDMMNAIHKMQNMTNSEWLEIVNKKPFTEYGTTYSIKAIARYIRNKINYKPYDLTQTYILCNKDFEPERYFKLQQMCNKLSLSSDNYVFMSSTYKHMMTEDIMKQYVKQDLVLRVRNIGMKKAEISLFLNYKEVLEHIQKTHKDGIFLILESDVFTLNNITAFDECVEKLKNKDWSVVNIGGEFGHIDQVPWSPTTIYRLDHQLPDIHILLSQHREDISKPNDHIRFIRKFHSRCLDSQIWSYKGCMQFLQHMNTETNYGVPLDYYLSHKAETDMNFKYYWSIPSYFDQASNRGMDASTIQNDTQ